MGFAEINYLAVVIAALVGFAVSGVWYRVFGGPWMEALGRAPEDIRPRPGPFILAFVAQLVMAYILAGLIGHLGGRVSIESSIATAAFIWLGFVATTIAVNDSFQGARPTLTFIDAGHWLVVLAVMGYVIGLIGT